MSNIVYRQGSLPIQPQIPAFSILIAAPHLLPTQLSHSSTRDETPFATNNKLPGSMYLEAKAFVDRMERLETPMFRKHADLRRGFSQDAGSLWIEVVGTKLP